MLPFGLLLAAIALGPLFFPDWWGKHYPKVAFALGAISVAYYLFNLHAYHEVLRVGHEYFSFIALIGSLFVVSGGIHINVKGEATPLANVIFLLVGALISNLLGTTGASMLLIRPWLRMNKYRVTGHHVLFFIFIVSNVGGCLMPIGDPPLFLGYLKGVPFWWVAQNCWQMWALGLAILLAMFYVVDARNYLRAPKPVREHLTEREQWRFDGRLNLIFLAVILGAVLINHPIFLREIVMTGAAVASYFTTRKSVHESNHFNFTPIKEVAILFVGIFATMMPALDWMQGNAGKLGINTPSVFYWGSGILSSVLDNAPTYLNFLSAAFGLFVDADTMNQIQHLVQNGGNTLAAVTGAHAQEIKQTFGVLQKYFPTEMAHQTVSAENIKMAYILANKSAQAFLAAISVGSVFFGANTYIGNGPNFLVKAIADHQKVHTPTFLGYIFKYTLPFMVPMLLIVWWIFFRG